MFSPPFAMVSGEGALPGPRPLPTELIRRFWVNVVNPKDQALTDQLASINQRDNFEKLKKSVNDVVCVWIRR